MADSGKSHWIDYEQRLSRVLAHIHDHLDEDLDLNRLAGIACLSSYHWHRVYHGMLGETAAQTVKRLRLHRAAGQLIATRLTMQEIAAKCGFNSVQVFSRAFRSAFGVAPAQYRLQQTRPASARPERNNSQAMYDVTIEHIPAATALTCEHRGPYMEISKAFDQLSGALAARNLFRPGMRMVALYYDDPAVVPSAQLRSRAGVVFPGNEVPETELTGEKTVPLERTPMAGGEYAVLRHKGPYAELGRAYQWLYGRWLPQSGREAADLPAFEEYFNTPRDTPPAELLTAICLPLSAI